MNRTLIATFLLLFVAACPLAAEPVEREWTVLVYAVTDSFLYSCVEADMDEMETGLAGQGDDPDVAVLVQLDRDDGGTRRYRIRPDGEPGKFTSPMVGWESGQDPGSWKTLDAFVAWGMRQAPSKRVMLVLHGCLGNLGYGPPVKGRTPTLAQLIDLGGYGDAGLPPVAALDRARLEQHFNMQRENGARYMGIRQMGLALRSIAARLGRPIDLVCCDDSCDTSIEKLAEYRVHVRHWVGSVGFMPSEDWPYDRILPHLLQDPEGEVESFCRRCVDEFRESYLPYCQLPFGFGATLTAYDLAAVEPLLRDLRDLGRLLERSAKESEHRWRLLDLRRVTLSFLSGDNLDLDAFLAGLQRLDLGDRDIPVVAAMARKSLAKVRLAHWAGGRVYGDASGASVTVSDWMGDYDRRKYGMLTWSAWSRWNLLLDRLGER